MDAAIFAPLKDPRLGHRSPSDPAILGAVSTHPPAAMNSIFRLHPPDNTSSKQQKGKWYSAILRLTGNDIQTVTDDEKEAEWAINDAGIILRSKVFPENKLAERLEMHNADYGQVRNLAEQCYHFRVDGPNGYFRSCVGSGAEPRIVVSIDDARSSSQSSSLTGNPEITVISEDQVNEFVAQIDDRNY